MLADQKLRCHASSCLCSNFSRLVETLEPLQYWLTHLEKYINYFIKETETSERKYQSTWMIEFLRILIFSRESHWRRGRLGMRGSKLQDYLRSRVQIWLWPVPSDHLKSGGEPYCRRKSSDDVFGTEHLRKSSDIIVALQKILALLGEKCHAYKLKKSWQVYQERLGRRSL